MGLKDDVQKKIDRKTQERQELEAQIRVMDGQLEVLREVLRMMPKEGADDKKSVITLRPNSDVSKVRAFLLKAGKPLHVGEILIGMGKENEKKNRLSLSGTLGDYVRKKEIFTRPAPNTFGLVEFPEQVINPVVNPGGDLKEPPIGFGRFQDMVGFDDSNPFEDE